MGSQDHSPLHQQIDHPNQFLLGMEENFQYPDGDVLQEAIFKKLDIKTLRLSDEIAAREEYLHQLGKQNVCSRKELRQAIVKFYQK